MSLTLLQRFRQLAQEEDEATAFKYYYQGNLHQIPWWIFESKVRYFGLGLLERGARPGNILYLFSSPHPNWIYSELGALSIGLQSIPIPRDFPKEKIADLFLRYPPAFIYSPDLNLIPSALLEKYRRQLNSFILAESQPETPENSSITTFRKIYNLGIITEDRHKATATTYLSELNEKSVASPVWISREKGLYYQELNFEKITQRTSEITQKCYFKKLKRNWMDVDFGFTEERIAAIYWPIYTGIQTMVRHHELPLLKQIKNNRCHMLTLGNSEEFQKCFENLFKKRKKGPSWSKGGFLTRLKIKWCLRRHFGRHLRMILAWGPPNEAQRQYLRIGKIQWVALKPDQEFPL